MGAKLLLNDSGYPIQILQPCVNEPLVEENEKSHLFMFRPAKGADVPAFDLSFLDIYYDLFNDGYGPSGINIPGYVTYLEEVVARQKSKINSCVIFGKLNLTSAMRQMLTEIKVR
jgi:hypothetical protein